MVLWVLMICTVSAAVSATAFFSYYYGMLSVRGWRPTTFGVVAACLVFIAVVPVLTFLGVHFKAGAATTSSPIFMLIPYGSLLPSSVVSIAIWRDSKAPYAAAAPVAGSIVGCFVVDSTDDFGFAVASVVLVWHALVFAALYVDARPRWRRDATKGGGPA